MTRHEVTLGLLAPLGVVALVVGSVFFAWLFILAAPILFFLGLFTFISGRVPRMVRVRTAVPASARVPAEAPARLPEFARENLEVLCIKGLRTEQALRERFRTALAELWAQAPEEQAVACSCVRRQGKSYYGILRMRTKQGHSYARVAGLSVRDVGERCVEQVEAYKRDFPIVMTETPLETEECNRKRCHLREHSIFHNGKNLVA